VNGSNGSHNIGAGSIGSRLHNSIEHEPTHIQHRCSVDSNKRNTRLISLSNTLKTKQQQQSKARSTQCSAPRPTHSVFRKMCGRPFLGSAPSFPKKLRICKQSIQKRSNSVRASSCQQIIHTRNKGQQHKQGKNGGVGTQAALPRLQII